MAARAVSPAIEELPTIPCYRLDGELGRGGMGIVYEALDENLSRSVAIKVVHAASRASSDVASRLRHEAQAIARLQHPHIAQVYEVGEFGGRPYLAMELLRGGSLQDRLKDGPLTAKCAAELVEKLARAVERAHEARLIHRDLKPANILFTEHDEPKIGDFGLAKHLEADAGLTLSGEIVGTPGYMAPEQALGESRRVTPQTDVYALAQLSMRR